MKRILTAAALVLALSACGSQAPPAPAPAPTTSAAPTVSPSTTNTAVAVPTMPAVARQPTKAGAIAFTKYYWRVVDYATATLDTSTLRSLQGERCGRCDAGNRWLDAIRRAGGSVHGGTNTVTVLDAIRLGTKQPAWAIEVEVAASPGRVTNAGDLDRRFPRGRAKDLFTVTYEAGSWTVASWRML